MAQRTKNRKEVSQSTIDKAMKRVVANLVRKLEQHGSGTWLSRHEILGITEEEVYELLKVVHKKESPSRMMEELADIAVCGIFGIACILEGGLEW